MRFTTIAKFRLLHVLTHSLASFGVYLAITRDMRPWLCLSFAMFLFAGIFGVNISLHRYFSHRSFKTTKLRHYFLLFCSFFPMLGSPAAWGSVHLFHHMTSDTAQDPHSPKNAGKFGSWFTFWPSVRIPLSIFKFFGEDTSINSLHKNYFTLVTLYILILAIFDWRLVPFLFAIPAVGCFHGAAAIAVLPHLAMPGAYRNHVTRDDSFNSVPAWILSLGEGWHNNHHHNPSNYRQGEKWWEIDPAAFIIKHFLKTP